MFENATHLQIHSGELEQAMKILRAEIVPILRAQTGLLSLALIPHTETNQVTILSLWASTACARAVEFRKDFRLAIQKLDPLLVENRREIRPGRPLSQPVLLAASAN